MLRAIFALVLILTCFVATAPALADHEGPYIVGEEKYLDGGPWIYCSTEEAARAIFSNITSFEKRGEMFQKYVRENVCGRIDNETVTVIGQIGNDTIDGTFVWRVVHVQINIGEMRVKDIYLFVRGTHTKVFLGRAS